VTGPQLSIVIPTYNRAAQLQLLLSDMGEILESAGDRIQLVVCDNASTDSTSELLLAHCASWPSTIVVRRRVNLGMEGNIACAMFEGDGKYIWTLSDHQRLCILGVQRLLELLDTVEFDIGHAKVIQWQRALPTQEQVMKWEMISGKQRGALLFSLGNLSTLIFRRELVRPAAKSIFKSCTWSYPHLGIISEIKATTRLVEFDDLSAFPSGTHATSLKHDYDKLSVRYRGNLRCVKLLAEQACLEFDRSGFYTQNYRTSFRGDVLQLLLSPGLSRRSVTRSLAPLIFYNPWSLKLIAAFVLAGCLLVPEAMRLRMAAFAKARIKRRYRQREPMKG
jgi:hypothetical protein